MVAHLEAEVAAGFINSAATLFHLRCMIHARPHLKEVSRDEIAADARRWAKIICAEPTGLKN